MYFVGMDIAKHHHEAAILDGSGKVVLKKLKFDNSHQGYDKFSSSQDNQTVHVINPI